MMIAVVAEKPETGGVPKGLTLVPGPLTDVSLSSATFRTVEEWVSLFLYHPASLHLSPFW